jgi:hypothetical protein
MTTDNSNTPDRINDNGGTLDEQILDCLKAISAGYTWLISDSEHAALDALGYLGKGNALELSVKGRDFLRAATAPMPMPAVKTIDLRDPEALAASNVDATAYASAWIVNLINTRSGIPPWGCRYTPTANDLREAAAYGAAIYFATTSVILRNLQCTFVHTGV